MRPTRWIPLVIVAAVIASTLVVFEPWRRFDDEEVAESSGPDAEEVARRDLVIEHDADGGLVHADQRTAHAVVEGQDGSVVTNIVDEDVVVSPGTVLWRIDDHPTVLLAGDQPSYRTLAQGDEGPDVLQLEFNLVALGFDPDGTVTVDETFTHNTALMVERWQASIRADVTGEVSEGTIVFASGERRVGAVEVAVGDAVTDGATMLVLTAQAREVTFTVEASDRSTVATGDTVDVRLPDRSTVTATVAEIVVDEAGGGQVTAHVDDPVEQAADNLPVTVSWSVTLAEGVVAVPESALLRTDAGVYFVEPVDGEPVAVVPGVAADGWVQVDGTVSPGDVVIAP